MVWFIAVTLVMGFSCLFVFLEYFNRNFEKHFGTPPYEPNEDDPAFLDYVNRKAHHLED